MEADAQGLSPDVLPLMRKKTQVMENMSLQQKFVDEQFAINTDLMTKNQELEERILAIENEIQLKKDQEAAAEEAVVGEEEIAPTSTPMENREVESIAGKSTRLGFIEKRLDQLESGGGTKRSKSKMSQSAKRESSMQEVA